MTSLFEKIGGEAAVEAAVDKFYVRVLADDRINYFFQGVDMEQQRKHQKGFLTFAFGGAPQYSGRSMRNAHKRLVEQMNLNDQHFDAVAANLAATLEELGVTPDMIQEVLGLVETLRNDVLSR
ncbi:MAG: group 1 truncated hemoglobin [Oscillatoriaceae cyanobacterium]